MSQHPNEDILFDYMNHALQGESQEIQGHVNSCPECQTVISDFELLTTTYSAHPLPQPSQKIIASALHYAEKKSRYKKSSWFRLPGYALAWGVLGVLVGVITLVISQEVFMNRETSVAKIIKPELLAEEVVTVSDATPLAEPVTIKAGVTVKIALDNTDFTDEGRKAPSAESASAEVAFVNLPQLFEQALEFKKQGDFAQAHQIFETLWTTDPNFSEKTKLLFEWADTLASLEKNAEALEKLNKLVQINPNYPGVTELRLRLMRPLSP